MKAYLSAMSVATILVAAIAISTGFGRVGIARGQGNLTNGNMTVGNMTLTPEQKDAICNPNNPLSKLNPVNTTESRICGIPKTLHINATSSNMTTGEAPTAAEEAPPASSSIAPSANTTTGMKTEAPPTNLAPSATPRLGE
jgi:hypothetical protein